MKNCRVMPRARMLANGVLVDALVSKLTTRDVCEITIDISVANLNLKYVYCFVCSLYDGPSSTNAFEQAVSTNNNGTMSQKPFPFARW